MGLVDPEELEDNFEIEFSQITGSSRHPAIPFWSARSPDLAPTSGQRRRRYSRIAALVAIISLVLINSLTLSGIFPAGLPFVSSTLSGEGMTARAAGYSWFSLRERPLRLPTLSAGAACPVTPVTELKFQLQTLRGMGNSTIFVTSSGVDANGVQRAERGDFIRLASAYRGIIATWYLKLPDVEPVLIRGAQLDGPNPLLFDGGIAQPKFANNLLAGSALPEIQLSSDPGHGTPVATWGTITRVASAGCYAYQVDTPTKTMVLVFEATVAP